MRDRRVERSPRSGAAESFVSWRTQRPVEAWGAPGNESVSRMWAIWARRAPGNDCSRKAAPTQATVRCQPPTAAVLTSAAGEYLDRLRRLRDPRPSNSPASSSSRPRTAHDGQMRCRRHRGRRRRPRCPGRHRRRLLPPDRRHAPRGSPYWRHSMAKADDGNN
jgi:hypothetical protein